MATLILAAILIALAAGCFSLGAWFATSDDPTERPSTEWDESMCARCPYNPRTNDEIM